MGMIKLKHNKIILQKLDIYDEEELEKLREGRRRDFRTKVGLDRPEYVYYPCFGNGGKEDSNSETTEI